jgi:hypothetical protein
MFRSLTSTLADELDVRVIYIGVMGRGGHCQARQSVARRRTLKSACWPTAMRSSGSLGRPQVRATSVGPRNFTSATRQPWSNPAAQPSEPRGCVVHPRPHAVPPPMHSAPTPRRHPQCASAQSHLGRRSRASPARCSAGARGRTPGAPSGHDVADSAPCVEAAVKELKLRLVRLEARRAPSRC